MRNRAHLSRRAQDAARERRAADMYARAARLRLQDEKLAEWTAAAVKREEEQAELNRARKARALDIPQKVNANCMTDADGCEVGTDEISDLIIEARRVERHTRTTLDTTVADLILKLIDAVERK